jgi:hypothetical protein
MTFAGCEGMRSVSQAPAAVPVEGGAHCMGVPCSGMIESAPKDGRVPRASLAQGTCL